MRFLCRRTRARRPNSLYKGYEIASGRVRKTDERPHASDCLLELCHFKLASNWVAYLSVWRNELAEARGVPRVGREPKRPPSHLVGNFS
jgi:hypothetical protein